MLAHAIALRQPLLAIFAACCEVQPLLLTLLYISDLSHYHVTVQGANVIACMCTWLCMSVDQQVVEKFVQLLNGEF